ncbi:MAG: MoaD/ThiS family protein [Clostridiales bacterium]|nr:MoaD/ThiS family protein [Clostridiales bacterium]
MAEITVKLFGVFRSDTHIASEKLNAVKASEIFAVLNDMIDKKFEENKKSDPDLEKPDPIRWQDAIVYINGEKCSHKNAKLNSGDEVWIMSPASGG